MLWKAEQFIINFSAVKGSILRQYFLFYFKEKISEQFE
jgi:hypothetical protein